MTQTHRDGCLEGTGRGGGLGPAHWIPGAPAGEESMRGVEVPIKAGRMGRVEDRLGAGPVGLKEHVVRTKGARIQKLTLM